MSIKYVPLNPGLDFGDIIDDDNFDMYQDILVLKVFPINVELFGDFAKSITAKKEYLKEKVKNPLIKISDIEIDDNVDTPPICEWSYILGECLVPSEKRKSIEKDRLKTIAIEQYFRLFKKYDINHSQIPPLSIDFFNDIQIFTDYLQQLGYVERPCNNSSSVIKISSSKMELFKALDKRVQVLRGNIETKLMKIVSKLNLQDVCIIEKIQDLSNIDVIVLEQKLRYIPDQTSRSYSTCMNEYRLALIKSWKDTIGNADPSWVGPLSKKHFMIKKEDDSFEEIAIQFNDVQYQLELKYESTKKTLSSKNSRSKSLTVERFFQLM